MAKKRLEYRSDALAVAHKTAVGLHRAGVIDKGTMREFDASYLTTVEELSPRAIHAIRERAGVSQRRVRELSHPARFRLQIGDRFSLLRGANAGHISSKYLKPHKNKSIKEKRNTQWVDVSFAFKLDCAKTQNAE